MTTEKVELIPWDPQSDAHYERLHKQRLACGWRHDEVGQWKEKQVKGIKSIYWIVLSKSLPDREAFLAKHLERYPAEIEPLVDTATSIKGLHRNPTGESFVPIGHTALELCPELIQRFDLPSSSIRVTSLYISWALQSGGFGRSAMSQTERIASQPPHSATLVAMDTFRRSTQQSEEFKRLAYDLKGLKRPPESFTNEEWYGRMGYEVIPTEDEEDVFLWDAKGNGENYPILQVYMKKTLSN